jgi:CMP-N-acetylneuraminic acid synthetase
MKVLALIPARSGSKSIPDKNIRPLAGLPLIAHSIQHGLQAKSVSRVIVSTDSEQYASIAKAHGAEVPFLRPEEFARDDSTDLQVFQHALNWLREHEGWTPDLCVHLRPTHPSRDPEDIDRAVRLLTAHSDLDSVRSVVCAPETPYKMWLRSADGMLSPIIKDGPPEAWNMPRQKLPTVYLQNASIDVAWTRTILEKNSMTGSRIHGFVLDHFFDIDTEEQWQAAESHLLAVRREGHPVAKGGHKVFCFDIDGVIASLTPKNDYALAQPLTEHIELINRLHAQGHEIILFTARGTVTGKDWKSVTESQLQAWGVKYHSLKFGKPAADFYIDDRFVTPQEIRRMLNQLVQENPS